MNRISVEFALQGKRIVLVISGSVAAYKALDLIRRLREAGASLHVILTKAAQNFITPLMVSALTDGQVFTDLFSYQNEQEIGHIRLAREVDCVIVAPCSASRLAKMAQGSGDDLAAAVILATKAPVFIAPAMNPAMWSHPTTQRNVVQLKRDGCYFVGPDIGEMAESDAYGVGRMSETSEIMTELMTLFTNPSGKLAGKHIIVTSGSTHEALDPVRYFANRSSGKQGHAIAAALSRLGADVTLISGPVTFADPVNLLTIHVETAQQMYEAVIDALPADVAILVAAVADWRVKESSPYKIKKQADTKEISFTMIENPDILSAIGHHSQRPQLVIGFAAETENLLQHAKSKLEKKNADWMIANNVSPDAKGRSIMGGDHNHVTIVTRFGNESFEEMSKQEVAEKLAQKIVAFFEKG